MGRGRDQGNDKEDDSVHKDIRRVAHPRALGAPVIPIYSQGLNKLFQEVDKNQVKYILTLDQYNFYSNIVERKKKKINQAYFKKI